MLRIEDTDRERSTPENIEQILDALRWLELDWDEGPILQTDRTARHREALQALLESGHAYRSHGHRGGRARVQGDPRGGRRAIAARRRGRGRCACTCPRRAPPSSTT